MEKVIKSFEEKIEKGIEFLKQNIAKLRTGRAQTAMFDGIRVMYYHTLTPLKQLANVATPESRLVTIQPWDVSVIGEIEKAILKSDLGLTPINDGKMIRINIPTLTEERRKELVKVVKKSGEECKITLRQHRRDAIEEIRKLEKAKQVSEDISKKGSERVQKILDSGIEKVDKLLEAKEKEIMEI